MIRWGQPIAEGAIGVPSETNLEPGRLAPRALARVSGRGVAALILALWVASAAAQPAPPPLEPSFATTQGRHAFWARQRDHSTEALPAGWERRHVAGEWKVARIQPVSQVLTSDAGACEPGHIQTYPDAPCVLHDPPDEPTEYRAGACYRDPTAPSS
jgi:hypothetical protein